MTHRTDAFATYLFRMESGLDCAGWHEAQDFADMGDMYDRATSEEVADALTLMIERYLANNRDVVVDLLAALVETTRTSERLIVELTVELDASNERRRAHLFEKENAQAERDAVRAELRRQAATAPVIADSDDVPGFLAHRVNGSPA